MILELQADLLVISSTVLKRALHCSMSACVWTRQEVWFVAVLLVNKLILFT